jgi:hypothetical protein
MSLAERTFFGYPVHAIGFQTNFIARKDGKGLPAFEGGRPHE